MRSGRGLPAWLATALLVSAVASGVSWLARVPGGTFPDVVLVTIDTLRADHCSIYGYQRLTTPRLDALSKAGTRIEAAYAPMATTTPSHATMFTGRLPRAHGVLKNGHSLSPIFPTLAESLRIHGYRTAAFVSSFPLARRFGLARGFAAYDDDFRSGTASMAPERWEGYLVDTPFDRRGDETVRQLEAVLDGLVAGRASGSDRRPVFIWLHLFDPHAPYTPPPHARFPVPADASPLADAIASYDGEVRFADEQLGRVVDALGARGRLNDALLIVAGDHGEGLMQHGHMEHGLQIYEEAVRVPLVFHWPGRVPAGAVLAGPVTLADLPATILELVGLPPEGFEIDGRSLAPALVAGQALDPERPMFLQRRYYESTNDAGIEVRGDKVGLRLGRWKYIEARDEASFEVYDLQADAGERENLFSPGLPVGQVLAATLAEWRRRPSPQSGGPVADDVAERLRALGYVR